MIINPGVAARNPRYPFVDGNQLLMTFKELGEAWFGDALRRVVLLSTDW
jgi:hypothetical protein